MCRQLIYLVCFVLVLPLAAASTTNADAPDPDVAWWKLDEGSGDNAVDGTGNGNDGTITGAGWTSPGFDDTGWCLEFYGSEYVNCGNDDSLNFGTGNWTVSAWIKTTMTGTEDEDKGTIFANGGDWGGGHRYTLAVSEITEGIVTLTTDDDSTKVQATGSTAVNDDVWHLVAGVRDGTTLRVYIDGEEDTTNTVSITYDLSGTSQHDAYIGAITDHRDSSMKKLFSGLIDDVRVYDYALSADQIKAMIPPKLKAYDPDPLDGAENVVLPLLQWTAGDTATFHDVYLGTDPTLGPADYMGRQPIAMYFHIPGFIPGATYYWRVDEVEVDGTTIHTGDVWSFSVPVLTASNPSPADGAKYVFIEADLSWREGFNAITHDVYFGTDETAVADGTGGTFKIKQPGTIYEPGTLAKDTKYYWRVDENDADGITHTGAVWSFTTVPDIPITDPDLLCWWKFDEGGGNTAVDWSGHDNHGTLEGPPQWVDGLVGGALEFGGDGDHIVDTGAGSYLNGLDAVTFCFWIKSNVTGTNSGFLICDTPSGGDDRDIRYDSAGGDTGGTNCMKYGITTTDANPEDESPSNTQTTEWQHVALVWSSGSQLQLYLNAVLTLSPQPSVAATGTLTGYTQLMVGKGSKDEGGNAGWDGLVDDVRVYNKALTQEEIKEAMRGDPLLAWNSKPAKGSTPDIDGATPLSWSPGDKAAKHDVYLGTDKDTVADADTTTTGIYRGRRDPNSYTPPEGVEFGQIYYWRIDEFNTDATISKGMIWRFTVAEYLVVDDFEPYDDYCNRIFYTWPDGWGHSGDPACGVAPYGGNGSGSTIGYLAEPYAEQTIVHQGNQSMPFEYLNDGSTGKALYSETELAFSPPQDWTRHAVKALTLWLRGNLPSVGSFSYDPATGIYTMTANGSDIFGTADEFHYAYKQLSGLGTIEAQILSVTDTDPWAKAGVMIRETLDANSTFAAVYIAPGNGCRFQGRFVTGEGAVSDSSVTELAHIEAPHWIKIERAAGNAFNAYDSNDPAAEGWHPLEWNSQNITMAGNVYIGLALTSHNGDPTVVCTAEFSDVATTGSVTGQWQSRDIGITSNAAEQLYVAVEDSTGKSKVVDHPDPNAAVSDTWQPWNIDLKDVSGAGVNLKSVKKMYIGVGDRAVPKFGGAGMLYIDDIRLHQARCLPSLLKPDADFNDNCVVDYPDLEIMANEWLVDANDLQADLNLDNEVNFMDYAGLADTWLDELLWPLP